MIISNTPTAKHHPAGKDGDSLNLCCITGDCIADNHIWQYECNDVIIAIEQYFMSNYGDLKSQIAIPAGHAISLARNCKVVLIVDTREWIRNRTGLDYDTGSHDTGSHDTGSHDTGSHYDTESDNETELDSETETSVCNVSMVEECFGADISQYLSYEVGWLTDWLVDLTAASPAAYMMVDSRAVFRFVCLDSLSLTAEDIDEIPTMPTLAHLVAGRGYRLPW